MYSYITKNKKVLDWKFKKILYGYEASLDNQIKLGKLYKEDISGWVAISYIYPSQSVKGFKSRTTAMEYLISLYSKKEKL